jgi:hypothetical protein
MPDSTPSGSDAIEVAQSDLAPTPVPIALPEPASSVIATQVATAQSHDPTRSEPDLAPEIMLPAPPGVDDLCAELKADQVKAIQHLVGGLSITDAAIASGVPRRTLFRWCKEDETFVAALNLWKHAQLESARTQALSLLSPALKTVGTAIQQGHVSASLQVIRGLGVLSPAKPGETDPDQLKRKRKIRKHRKQQRLEQLEQKYRVPDDNPIKTLDQWHQHLDKALELRDDIIRANEEEWRVYELTLHMTPEQCERRSLEKPSGPPACPRPSEAETIAMIEHECRRMPWLEFTSRLHCYLARGRHAAEAAKGPPPQQPE